MTSSRSHCARCGSALVLHATGRPKAYCSAACRVAASRARLAAPVQLVDQLPGQRALIFERPHLAVLGMCHTMARSDVELVKFSTADLLAAAGCLAGSDAFKMRPWQCDLLREIVAELTTRVV